MIKPV